jgi:hypothetical protein
MQPTWNNQGIAHENGDVEQAHHRFKEALDQALRVRGSREFASRAEYWRFVCDLIARRNRSRVARWHEEQAALRPLPRLPLVPCKEVQVRVWLLTHDPSGLQCLFRPISPDRHQTAGAPARPNHRRLCRHQTGLYASTVGRRASASHRLPSLHLVEGRVSREPSLPTATVTNCFPPQPFASPTTDCARTWPGGQMGSMSSSCTWRPVPAAGRG